MNLDIILRFLSELEKNNNRDWFQDNKSKYLEAHQAFIELTAHMIDQIGKFDQEISVLEPKKCVFRIYRDVRFSKNKAPYKTNFGASMRPGGRKSPFGGFYLQIQPDESFVAGGMYHPEPRHLAKIRQEIDYNPEPIRKIISGKKFISAFESVTGDQLKRPPKGFDAEHPDIALLKHKDFIVYSSLKNVIVKSPQFLDVAISTYKLMKPFNDYFNTAIQD
jgi:uncharacterized protein (TIGR02453 family)